MCRWHYQGVYVRAGADLKNIYIYRGDEEGRGVLGGVA